MLESFGTVLQTRQKYYKIARPFSFVQLQSHQSTFWTRKCFLVHFLPQSWAVSNWITPSWSLQGKQRGNATFWGLEIWGSHWGISDNRTTFWPVNGAWAGFLLLWGVAEWQLGGKSSKDSLSGWWSQCPISWRATSLGKCQWWSSGSTLSRSLPSWTRCIG